jgi:S-disulfanyl-L-cysteine oxidoreductase SoxD
MSTCKRAAHRSRVLGAPFGFTFGSQFVFMFVFTFGFVFMFGFVSAQGPSTALGTSPGLGHPISEADVAAWDISVLPDGTGLPAGSGTAEQGSKVFAAKCAVCHGENGKGGSAAALVGGQPLTSGIETTKTVANFWPYATTIFDFTRRAMPWPRPRTLTNEEVYSLTAFILAQNKIIAADEVMNAQTLPKVRMPNREGFIPRFPERIP